MIQILLIFLFQRDSINTSFDSRHSVQTTYALGRLYRCMWILYALYVVVVIAIVVTFFYFVCLPASCLLLLLNALNISLDSIQNCIIIDTKPLSLSFPVYFGISFLFHVKPVVNPTLISMSECRHSCVSIWVYGTLYALEQIIDWFVYVFNNQMCYSGQHGVLLKH